MAYNDRTYPIVRQNLGNQRGRGGTRHILGISYGYTNHEVRAAAGAAAAIVAATATSGSVTTTILPTAQPDVPRALSVTFAGTAGDIKAVAVTITGKNVEGKTITDTFTPTVDTAGTISGTKAFKSVTSISVPAQDGAGVTVAVDTLDLLGLNHRLPTGTTTANVRIVSTSNVKNITAANLGANGVKTLQSTPSAVAVSPSLVESNTVTPATLPDGTFHMSIHYYYVKWVLDPINDLTGTSTSTTNYGAE